MIRTLGGEKNMNKKLLKLFLLTITTVTTFCPVHSSTRRFAIFDSNRTEKHCYQPVIDIIRSHKFDVSYYGLDTIIDTPVSRVPFYKYDCMFFILSPNLIRSLEKDISNKLLAYISRAAQDPHKMVGLLFPTTGLSPHDPTGSLSPLFDRVGFDNQNSILKKLTNRFLRLPFNHRLISYHTTLKIPPAGGALFNVRQDFRGSSSSLALLPLHQDHHPRQVQNLFPLGIYWYNKQKKNHLFISNSSLFSFSGIMENFSFCPMKEKIRQEVLQAVHEMFGDISRIFTQPKTVMGISVEPIEPIKKIKQIKAITKKADLSSLDGKKIFIAWMELKDDPDEQKKLIEYIFISKLDHLWITLNPQEYHSPIGKKSKQVEQFYKKLSAFTKMLSLESKKKKYKSLKTPEILVGFEIVNNLYKPNLPTEFAHDMYGNKYEDIPRPLDAAFWRNELTHPLQEFLSRWKNKKISNGIKISGVAIDLEMYLRKKTASFLPTMGFSPETVKIFLQKKNLYPELPANLLPQLLAEKKWGKEYFSYLENQAAALGKQISTVVHNGIKDGFIYCYAPNISLDWFYKGFYRGLSSKEKPIHLLTFNSDFMSHKKFLEKNQIFAKHSSALMLSKIRSVSDFKLTNEILEKHNGVWLNRYSRFTEPPKNNWSILEQTPMNQDGRLAFLRYLGNLGRKSEKPVKKLVKK